MIGILVTPIHTGDMFKYLRDGAEVDGQIIRYSHSCLEKHELGGYFIKLKKKEKRMTDEK